MESLTKRYGRTLALDRLSLEVRAREVLGYLGPNGAGKTTTLRLLMGYLRPAGGSARVCGLDAWRDRVGVHSRTGYLPRDVRLWPRLTARMAAEHLARLRGLHDDGVPAAASAADVDRCSRDWDQVVQELRDHHRDPHTPVRYRLERDRRRAVYGVRGTDEEHRVVHLA